MRKGRLSDYFLNLIRFSPMENKTFAELCGAPMRGGKIVFQEKGLL
jgi:hypothetical protein